MTVGFREQFVWPLALRVIHWFLAIAVTVLLLTGWLLESGLVLNDALHQLFRESLHIPAGKVAGVALAARLVLLAFDTGVAGWRALLPSAGGVRRSADMLKFYLSFGRRRLPPYFAHDPLWGLVYPFWILLLGFQVVCGIAVASDRPTGFAGLPGDTWARWHATLSGPIFWLVLLHLLSVLLREVRGRAYDISALVHGSRIFRIDRSAVAGDRDITIAVKDILKPQARRD